MRWLRFLVVVGLLACLAPMISMFGASLVADYYDCRLHEGFANPCLVGGRDIGETLYQMAVSGWLMIFTLPIGALLLIVWVLAEFVHFTRRRLAARRARR